MDESSRVFEIQINELMELAERLKVQLGSTPVSKGLREAIEGIYAQHSKYLEQVANDGDADAILKSVKRVGTYGLLASQRVSAMQSLDEHTKTIGSLMGQLAMTLRNRAENDPGTYAPLGDVPAFSPISARTMPNSQSPNSHMKHLEQLMLDQEKHDERIKNSLAENERRLTVVAESLGKLEQQAQESLSKVDDAYSQTIDALEEKKQQVDAILGHVSGRAIAGDYEKSATSEKTAAEWLRAGSLFCMVLIAVVLGYSFWETIQEDFRWQKALFRVILAFLLSAPAAYLARESAKHRAQQYAHLQTSLDLKAISPYLASLPEDVQHRIKTDVAAKLFASREPSLTTGDSYPVNAQELLLELIKRLELPKASASK